MPIDVRPITDSEVPAWCAAMAAGFHRPIGDIDAEARRPGLFLDRTWAGFDGGTVVSTLCSWPTELTLPGGSAVPAAAVTAVTATATHRRQGLASRMMIGDLAAAKDRGELAAILIAAEWPIYGRFGFGPGTEQHGWTIDTRSARIRRPVEGSVELVDMQTGRATAASLHEQARKSRPGDISWLNSRWDLEFGLLQYPSAGEPTKFFTAVAKDPAGTPIGLLRYTYEENWTDWRPGSTVTVELLLAVDARASALLWSYLVEMDLVATVLAELRPVDEPVPWYLTDGRHARASERGDFLWIRLLDTAGFLTTRTYPASDRLVLEVIDPVGLAGGRFALDAGEDGATCRPTTESADLSLGMSQLGSICVGGYPLSMLHAAGLVDEDTPGAVHRADELFRSPVTPWCSLLF